MPLKLGAHSLVEVGDTLAWANLGAVSVKLCYDFSLAARLPAGCLVVGRPEENFIGEHPVGQGDPVALGQEFAWTVYAPLVAAHPRVDVWEGPNEFNPDDLAQMDWYARFLAEFARNVQALGRRAALGSFATGTPRLELWPAYRPALVAAQQYGAFLARHCYGPLDEWNAYRYRQDQAIFNNLGFYPEVLLTECGEDAPDPPWRQAFDGHIERYWQEWIRPFLLEINRDAYVRAAHLFTVGDGHSVTWHNFDVSGTGLLEFLRLETVQNTGRKGKMYISTLVTRQDTDTPGISDEEAADVDRAFTTLHRYVAEHLTAKGFQWNGQPWWEEYTGIIHGSEWVGSFVCRAREDRGGFIVLYHTPADAAPFAHREATWDITVRKARVDARAVWFMVAPVGQADYWVMGNLDCRKK